MADDLRLRVNGREYGGWLSASVSRGMESVAGSFEVTASDRWAGQDVAWPIVEEDVCELLIDDETLITGYVDRPRRSISAEDHSLSISGRDRAGTLVDCSVVLGNRWEFIGLSVLTFVTNIAKPYGIPVALQPGLALPPPLPKVVIDPGESAFDAIEKACRMAAVLPISDGKGGLLLVRAGTARTATAIVEGENLLSGSRETDATGRYRRYVVIGQHPGSDDFWGADAASIRGEAQDLGVQRPERVLMVRAETCVTWGAAKRRAEWEATVRAARADTVSVTLQGWRQGDGSLWPLNTLVPIRSQRLGLDGEMLISEVTYRIDATGRSTELALRNPKAFLPDPTLLQTAGVLWKELNSVQRKK